MKEFFLIKLQATASHCKREKRTAPRVFSWEFNNFSFSDQQFMAATSK